MLNFLLTFLAFFLIDGVEPAHAGPIAAAIVAIGNVLGGLGIVGKILLTVGLAIGQTLLQKALAKKNKPQDQIQGADLEIKMGDDLPVSTTLGTYATAGKRKYIGAFGKDGKTPNAYLVDVIELGNIPVGPLVELWINDKKCTLNMDTPGLDGAGYSIPEFVDGGKPHAWWKFYDGTQTVADPYLILKFGSHATRPWDNTMIGRGVPYIILTYRLNQKLFSNSLPSASIVTRGAKLYDIRKDSTEGGSGAHRWNDQSTWEPSDNPFVQAYNIARGLSYGGKWFFGGQNVSTKRLPTSAWVAAMNACDASRSLEGGGTEPMFRSGIELKGENEPLAIIEYLRGAANGRVVEIGGKLKPFAGALGAAEAAFTDGDIIVTEGQTFEPFPMLDDIFNGATATYPEPAEKWASKDAPPYYVDDLEAEDGDRRLVAALQYPAVPYPVQVQALMKTAVDEGRRFRTHQFFLPPAYWGLEPGDVVTWTSNINGYDDKKFIVLTIEGELTYNQLVTLREVDPSDYSWSPTFQKPVVIGPVGPVLVPTQLIPGWSVSASSFSDDSASPRRPAIAIAADPEIDDLRAIKIQIVHVATGALVETRELPYTIDDQYQWTITGSFLFPGEDYQVRGIQVPFGSRTVDWTPFTTIEMFPLAFSSRDVLDDAITAAKIADAAVTASKIMDAAITELKLADLAVSTAKLKLAAVTSDILASNAVISSKLADAAVTAAKLAAEAVDATKFASGIKPVEIVSALPGGPHVQGRVVFLTTDNKMYRNTGSGWTPSVAAVDMTGQIAGSQIADLAITNAKLAALAVDAAKIAANAITETKIADNAITTPKITANAIVGDKIAANTISVIKLIMADFNNRVENPNFGEGDVGWFKAGGGVAIVNDPANAFTGNYYLDFPAGSTSGTRNATIFPVIPGETYRLAVTARAVGAPNQPLNCRIRFMAADKLALIGVAVPINFTAADNAGYVQKIGQGVVPAGAVYAWVDTQFTVFSGGSYRVGFVSCMRKDAAELIVDGTIISNHLASGSVTTAKLVAGAVTANELAANSVIAGKIAAGAVSATEIAANAITAVKIAGGTITADKLAIGVGANYIENSDFATGISATWGLRSSNGAGNFTVSLRTDNYGVAGGSYQIYHNTLNAANYYDVTPWDVVTNSAKMYPVEAGERYQFSVYTYAHRANRQIFIGWRDAAGVDISYPNLLISSPEGGNPAGLLSNYRRDVVFGTAPANAASAIVFVRHAGTLAGNADSYVWFKNAMFAKAAANQTLPSEWAPSGTTMVTGGQIVTGSIVAGNMAANSITTAAIAAGAVTATELASNSVTAIKIAAGTITGDKIAANTIGADQIAANAIMARHLVVTDFENMVPDGYFQGTYAGGIPLPIWAGTANSNVHINGTGLGKTGNQVLVVQKTLLTASIYAQMQTGYAFPVTEGDRIYGETEISTNSGSGASVGFYFRIVWLNASKAEVGTNDFASNAPIPSAWTKYTGEYTVPAGARYAIIRLYNHNTQTTMANLLVDRVVIRRMRGAELIVDGTITANHIAANTITAAKIAVGTITADRIVINGITTDRLALECVTAAAGARTAGAVSCTAGVETTLQSVVVTGVSSSFAQLLGSFFVNLHEFSVASGGGTQTSISLTIRLYRDSTLIHTLNTYLAMTGFEWDNVGYWFIRKAFFGGVHPTIFKDDTPTVGSQTYSIRVVPGRTISISERNLFASIIKR